MTDFLTAKQVIELLNVDRTTLYRMIKENRIKGVKVGSHWRFSANEVDAIMNGRTPDISYSFEPPKEVLPIHCIQPIQEVFSDIIGVTALTTDSDGNPLTEISNPSQFCKMIMSAELGRQACRNSWKNLKFSNDGKPVFNTCHAGLKYSGASIKLENAEVAKLITGQYFISKPKADFNKNIKSLAQHFGLDNKELLAAAGRITILEERTKQVMAKWLLKIARSFERMAEERKALLNKLKNIAEISNF
jgi:excisionase family DNA binding protein